MAGCFPPAQCAQGYAAACPINISITGSVTTGSAGCVIAGTIGTGATLVPPTGALQINSACKVAGTINYEINSVVVQGTYSLWLSKNGDRLSGFMSANHPVGFFVYPVEMIAGP